MTRIYWDTMLFIYWLEDTPVFGEQVASVYESMLARGDVLCGSTFTIAELLVAPRKLGDESLEKRILQFFDSKDIEVLPFDIAAARQFARIRAEAKVSPADAIHLACASAAGVDLFLTNDAKVRKQFVPGIRFIDGLDTTVLIRPSE